MWRQICQSITGRAHDGDGTGCQDHCLVRVLGEGADSALVACVADGAGSAKHSGDGSSLACESIVESALQFFQEQGSFDALEEAVVLDWCDAARRTLSDHAETHERRLRDYASTLCVAVMAKGRSVFFQIGDGAIVAKSNGVFGVVFWPQSGEYINTTNFLTSPDFREQVQVWTASTDFSDVALLTDGLERLALRFDIFTPHPPFFQPLFGVLRSTADLGTLEEDLRQFLQSDPVQNKNDDDKTLILASRISADRDGVDRGG